jgi:4-azaleucine resistance transporter AzlC
MASIAREREGSFTAHSLLAGARRSIPLALSDAAYGVVFGVLARQAGLSLPECVLMSGLVFAGSAQFIALGLWTTPLPGVSLVLTTLVVNLRHLLMGATLRPWLAHLSSLKRYSSLFFLSDESWALSIGEYEQGKSNGAFLVGSGVLLYSAWLSGTIVGRLGGAVVGNPAAWGLDFAFTALFVALLAARYKDGRDLLPWLAAGLVAVGAAGALPGKWYILLGGLAGGVVGVIRDAD